ncbi:uncharacterized protein EKO05_0010496 [Ascochyta rabiei]|uniref:uncharacterized protein n=1 Tax=Didymella rabiei TaxID=5454 RepID=UPI00220C4B4D|nr:uncharacterized protein EKO05_0010496 [Ascochyta rabiei]UPX20257.1 hypothetical protein EKO05_0010496 [Ascochyta rabiei]
MAGVLALFIVDELLNGESMDAGRATGNILGVFFGILAVEYTFLYPNFIGALSRTTLKYNRGIFHLEPYSTERTPQSTGPEKSSTDSPTNYLKKSPLKDIPLSDPTPIAEGLSHNSNEGLYTSIDIDNDLHDASKALPSCQLSMPNDRGDLVAHVIPKKPEPEERFLEPVRHLPSNSPKNTTNWTTFLLLQDVSRDVVTQKSKPKSEELVSFTHSLLQILVQ